MKCLIIDAQIAGASGDMFLGALLDLLYKDENNQKEADKKRQKFISDIANILPKLTDLDDKKSKITVEIKRKNNFAFEGIQLQIDIQEPHRHIMKDQAIAIIEKTSNYFKFSSIGKIFYQSAINILFEAEALAHGESLEKVHLHEAGSLDTFLDLIAVSLLLEKLELFNSEIYILPVALGSGTVTFSHGTLPVPVPAVAEIVRKYKIPTKIGTLDGELLTPTGAIIIASLISLKQVKIIKNPPILSIDRIGIGLGMREYDKSPNGLRLILGKSIEDNIPSEEIAIIETNLDDCSGETIGFLTERLLEMGAKDAFLTPIYMKKNRPATKISVLCNSEDVEKFAMEIMNQTSTIGVRIINSTKLMLKREIKNYQITIKSKNFNVRGKIAYNKDGEIAHFKPEFDDIKIITDETGLTINEVVSEVRGIIKKELEKK